MSNGTPVLLTNCFLVVVWHFWRCQVVPIISDRIIKILRMNHVFLRIQLKLNQSQKNLVSASAMLTGKFLRHVHYWLKNFRIIWKTTGCYIKIICKASGWPGKCLDDLKSVCMIWKVSGQLAETSSGSKIRRPLGTLPPPFGEKEAQYGLKYQNLLVLLAINDYEVTSWHDACHEAR